MSATTQYTNSMAMAKIEDVDLEAAAEWIEQCKDAGQFNEKAPIESIWSLKYGLANGHAFAREKCEARIAELEHQLNGGRVMVEVEQVEQVDLDKAYRDGWFDGVQSFFERRPEKSPWAELEARIAELKRERDDMARAELGAVIVATEALGVTADAIRKTARSRAAEYLGEAGRPESAERYSLWCVDMRGPGRRYHPLQAPVEGPFESRQEAQEWADSDPDCEPGQFRIRKARHVDELWSCQEDGIYVCEEDE